MLGFWDWVGSYKIVHISGYSCLCGPSVNPQEWAEWWYDMQGRLPHITGVYAVSQEWYEEWKDRYANKGLLCEGTELGDEL